MTTRTLIMGAAAAALFATPATLSAQQQELPPQVQGWLIEMQQIETRLAPIQEEALDDPQIQQQQEAVVQAVRTAMIEADPSMAQIIDRMEALIVEARAAQEAGDQERIIAVAAEAEEIQPAFARAQAEALEQPEVASRLDRFQENLHARMAQIDPEAPTLLARYRALEEQVAVAMRGGD
jgi:hypothetical protein